MNKQEEIIDNRMHETYETQYKKLCSRQDDIFEVWKETTGRAKEIYANRLTQLDDWIELVEYRMSVMGFDHV